VHNFKSAQFYTLKSHCLPSWSTQCVTAIQDRDGK